MTVGKCSLSVSRAKGVHSKRQRGEKEEKGSNFIVEGKIYGLEL